MPLLEPVSVAALVYLIWDRLKEATAKFVASCCEFSVSFDVVELQAFVKLAVAYWTKVRRMCISLFEMVRALHKTLIPRTVTHSKHMPKLMCNNF